MNNFPTLHTTKEAQELYTPPEAVDIIMPFLNKELIIWEMCYGEGHLANVLTDNGFDVKGDKTMDCFIQEPDYYNIIVTNPPFRNNKDFLKRCIDSKKPFCLLLRLEHLGGVKAFELLKDLDFKIVIPKKRINFITPKMMKGIKVGGSPFHSIWLTYKIIDSQKQIIYI